jgi:hypothetical protein
MKSLPIALDRMLANPSYERIEGKLIKVVPDNSRVILELKGKKFRTLMAPFGEATYIGLQDKAIVAFVKAGDTTQIFDAKLIPREHKAVAASPSGSLTKKRAAPKADTGYGPRAKWKKFAEGRMVGEPVKLTNMERGFGFEPDFVLSILTHLEIPVGSVTKSIAYADFRKVFHFICEPGFKAFQGGYFPTSAPKAAAADEVDADDDDAVEDED